MNDNGSNEQDEELELRGNTPTRVSGITVIVVVTVTAILAMVIATALGTLWAVISQAAAGWVKLPTLQVLGASVAVAMIAGLVAVTLSLTSSLNEIRDAFDESAGLSPGLIRHVLWKKIVEDVADEYTSSPRRRTRRKPSSSKARDS